MVTTGKLPLALAAILFLSVPILSETDVTIKYADSVSLTCDSIALNVSDHIADINKLYWILNDGSVIDSVSTTPKDIVLSSNGYTLNLTEVKDDMFGYYHCVVLYKDGRLKVVRKGLNINGPDYTDLYEGFKRSALIGGIAAAVMLAIIGMGCIIWHFRFRHDDDESEDLYKIRDSNSDIPMTSYDNSALEIETKTTPEEDKANGAYDEKL